MNTNNVEFDVYINGRPVTYYEKFDTAYDKTTFIEGRSGSVYSLKITNRNPFKVLAIPSVDGLSVLDGKPASTNSKGYILNAYDSIEIPGWTVDDKTAAKFMFGAVKSSYSTQSGEGENNVGVLGLTVWKEKVQAYAGPVYYSPTYTYRDSPFRSYDTVSMSTSNPRRKQLAPSGVGGTYQGVAGVATGQLLSSNYGNQTINATFSNVDVSSVQLNNTEAVPQNLGTEFGDATKFSTYTSTFDKDFILCIMEIFYDDATGLASRGIYVNGPKTQIKPKAFPLGSTGCTPPPGWKK